MPLSGPGRLIVKSADPTNQWKTTPVTAVSTGPQAGKNRASHLGCEHNPITLERFWVAHEMGHGTKADRSDVCAAQA